MRILTLAHCENRMFFRGRRPEGKRPAVAREILRRWSPPARADWRAWSWGRARAWDAVDDNRATLEALAR